MLIAQVTDIHAAPGNENLSRFDRALSWLTHLQPDVLVITGDLTDGQWQEGYRAIAHRLSQHRFPSLILPGNADDRSLMRAIWGEKRWAQDVKGDALHVIHHSGDLRLIGLDSTVVHQDYGSVTEHLDWLERQLNNAGNSPCFLFLHHNVFASGIPPLDKTMCRGLTELEALIRRAPARLLAVATGHVHRSITGVFAGIPASICGSICPANPVWFGSENVPPADDPPVLMVHRYASGAVITHQVCV